MWPRTRLSLAELPGFINGLVPLDTLKDINPRRFDLRKEVELGDTADIRLVPLEPLGEVLFRLQKNKLVGQYDIYQLQHSLIHTVGIYSRLKSSSAINAEAMVFMVSNASLSNSIVMGGFGSLEVTGS